jgi:quinol monooxygenase YgiN
MIPVVAQTEARPDTILVIEKWESMDPLAAHASAPHMKVLAANIKDMVASRAVHILSPA